jgi:uncharacterized OB-fold protein
MPHHDLMEQEGPARLRGARDGETGQIYFPFRTLAADGSLRPCEQVALSSKGVLVSWTRMGKQCFGLIDLQEGVRVQTSLDDGEHRTGARYFLEVVDGEGGENTWRFKREY